MEAARTATRESSAILAGESVVAGHPRETATADRSTTSQRIFDIGLTLLIAPFAIVVGLLTAWAVYLDSPGKVLYRSTRVGRGGQEFCMWKFRKMRRSATGISLTLHQDERFTPVGQFLAMTKLDELPQLWNVLRGDMRLVGPRPETLEFVQEYPEAYREILKVTPGITGPAALECSGEGHMLRLQHDPVAYYLQNLMPRKIAIDVAYARGHSIPGDLYVLVRTFFVPLNRLARRIVPASGSHRARGAMLAMSAIVLLAAFALTGATQV